MYIHMSKKNNPKTNHNMLKTVKIFILKSQ